MSVGKKTAALREQLNGIASDELLDRYGTHVSSFADRIVDTLWDEQGDRRLALFEVTLACAVKVLAEVESEIPGTSEEIDDLRSDLEALAQCWREIPGSDTGAP